MVKQHHHHVKICMGFGKLLSLPPAPCPPIEKRFIEICGRSYYSKPHALVYSYIWYENRLLLHLMLCHFGACCWFAWELTIIALCGCGLENIATTREITFTLISVQWHNDIMTLLNCLQIQNDIAYNCTLVSMTTTKHTVIPHSIQLHNLCYNIKML